jgi:hypothetical protein
MIKQEKNQTTINETMKTFNNLLLLFLLLLLIGCEHSTKKENNQNKSDKIETNQTYLMAEQIKIDELKIALIKLQKGQTEYDFIGITSNGIDCIYFIYEDEKFNLEFEAMTEEQIPYIDKLKNFADNNHFQSVKTTYNNKPLYKSSSPAPVLRIETNYSLEEIIAIGERIQTEIFNNNEETVYEVVP